MGWLSCRREQIYSVLSGKKIICIAGAPLYGWHNTLTNDNRKKAGTEFDAASSFSTGLEELYSDDPIINLGLEQADTVLMDAANYSKFSKR